MLVFDVLQGLLITSGLSLTLALALPVFDEAVVASVVVVHALARLSENDLVQVLAIEALGVLLPPNVGDLLAHEAAVGGLVPSVVGRPVLVITVWVAGVPVPLASSFVQGGEVQRNHHSVGSLRGVCLQH